MSRSAAAGAAATTPVPATRPTAQTAPSATPAPVPASMSPTTTRDTPRDLRRLSTAVIVAGVLFGLAGLATFVLLSVQLQRAEASTAQLIRVQLVQTDLLRADANATNAFLVGGLEPVDQRQAYDAAIADASRVIAEAAEAEPADQAALSELNTQLLDYTAAIALARANNRQGFPVGAQYLRTASSGLRADTLPILDNLVEANAARAAGQMNARVALLFGAVGLIVLAGLVWTQVWLARRFKRRFNVGLALASAVGALTLVAGLVGFGLTAARLDAIESGSFATVRNGAAARIAGNDAKSNESLTLIARGSGAAFEEAWQRSATVVTDLLPAVGRDLLVLWQPYADDHARIRELDDGGQWDQAVALATSDANTTFASFDETVARVVDDASGRTTSGLSAMVPWLVVGSLLSLAAGVVMAVLGRRGVAERLREYR